MLPHLDPLATAPPFCVGLMALQYFTMSFPKRKCTHGSSALPRSSWHLCMCQLTTLPVAHIHPQPMKCWVRRHGVPCRSRQPMTRNHPRPIHVGRGEGHAPCQPRRLIMRTSLYVSAHGACQGSGPPQQRRSILQGTCTQNRGPLHSCIDLFLVLCRAWYWCRWRPLPGKTPYGAMYFVLQRAKCFSWRRTYPVKMPLAAPSHANSWLDERAACPLPAPTPNQAAADMAKAVRVPEMHGLIQVCRLL